MMMKPLSKNKVNSSWIKYLTLEWVNALEDMLSSKYAEQLEIFIEQIYLSGKEVYPMKNRLFESLKKCSLSDVKIVVIDDRPIKDLRSSGIGRGLIETSSLNKDLPKELIEFRDCIYQTIYGNQYDTTNFDNSLDEYCDNDMLFLNCSMCVEKDEDYTVIWKNFIRNIIKIINSQKEKVVYVFLTGDNLDLCEYIDQNENKIIINPFPEIKKDSSIFVDLDEYIEDNYPYYNRITW